MCQDVMVVDHFDRSVLYVRTGCMLHMFFADNNCVDPVRCKPDTTHF